MNEPLDVPIFTMPNTCCSQQSRSPRSVPMMAPETEMRLPSIMNMRRMRVSGAPRLLSVATSSFLSIMSIESEPMMLKQAMTRMNVRKKYARTFSICMMR